MTRGVGGCFFQQFDDPLFFSEANKYCFLLKGGIISNPSGFDVVSGGTELEGTPLNLALRKPTNQSSVTGTKSVDAPGDSDFAVDGNVKQIFSNDAWQFNTVTRTEPEKGPYWEVDLEEDTIIRKIVIYKRRDTYQDDLKAFTITIYDTNDIVTATHTSNGIATAISTYEFASVTGRRINIKLNGNFPRVLCLAEVEVYGAVFEFDLQIGKMFNFPEMSINRLAFIQDSTEQLREGNEYSDHESSLFRDLSFYEHAPNNKAAVVSTHCYMP